MALPSNPSARYRVVKVIPHLVYHVKKNDLQQLKGPIRDAVASVNPQCASKHVDRDRISSGYLS
jgi:hypothetical protein